MFLCSHWSIQRFTIGAIVKCPAKHGIYDGTCMLTEKTVCLPHDRKAEHTLILSKFPSLLSVYYMYEYRLLFTAQNTFQPILKVSLSLIRLSAKSEKSFTATNNTGALCYCSNSMYT